MFQLAHLTFTAPRLDTVVFRPFSGPGGDSSRQPRTVSRRRIPGHDPGDTGQHAFRARPLTPAVFDEVKPQKSLAFYKDRFANASDFTFVLVGNVDTAAIKPMVETYLASLPNTGRVEKSRDTGVKPPKGFVERIVRKGSEQKASTRLVFTGACTYTPENRFIMRALTTLMQTRLNESLRERLGGTYSPNVGGSCQREPRQEYAITVGFGSSPENVEVLSKATLALVDSLKATAGTAG